MTSTPTPPTPPPPPPPAAPAPPAPPPAGHRVVRRSRTDRVAAGVCGGLGEYFGLDPVLFRVLFAVAAFFGGAGVLAYLIAWAAIPEAGTERAAVDGWMAELRRRRVPVWLVLAVGLAVLWGVAFSWWAPGPFTPVVVIVIVLVVVFGRRGGNQAPPSVSAGDATAGPAGQAGWWSPAGSTPPGAPDQQPAPPAPSQFAAWLSESRAASRRRRQRAFPVRVAVLVTLVVTLVSLAIADAVSGVWIPVYFWATFGIVLLGLLVGMVLRRTPWTLAVLLIPSLAGIVAFGNTHASWRDGVGNQSWSAADAGGIQPEYRLAVGRATLDLSNIAPLTVARTVDVTVAAGDVRVLLPADLNATVDANVRFGEIDVDGTTIAQIRGHSRVGGMDIGRTVPPPSGATGAPLTIDVHLADGQISVDHG